MQCSRVQMRALNESRAFEMQISITSGPTGQCLVHEHIYMWVYKCKQKVAERNIIVAEQWNWVAFFLWDVPSSSPPAKAETTAELLCLSCHDGQAFFLPKGCNQMMIHGTLWQSFHLSLQSSSGILSSVQVLNIASLHLLPLKQNKANAVSSSSTGYETFGKQC